NVISKSERLWPRGTLARGTVRMISPERFTDQAREALGRAQESVARLRHPALDVEHVLLALFSQPEGLVADAVKRLGADARVAAQRLEAELGRRQVGTAPAP